MGHEDAAEYGRVKGEMMTMSTIDVPVLIVGGGIVGAGIARDAAMRGLRVGLVEQHDFAFGTSSRSSRLLHGGLRYLAQGRIRLVHEASVKKTMLHHLAPHLPAELQRSSKIAGCQLAKASASSISPAPPSRSFRR